MRRLRCGLLGLAGRGQDLLEAVASSPVVELIAIGDPGQPDLRRTAEKFRVQAFEDCRSLLVEMSPEALFCALPVYQAADYLPVAAERGIGVFQLTPWAIDFESAAGLVRLFESCRCPHVIARLWRVEPAYQRLGEVREFFGRVYAVEVHVSAPRPDREGWLGDAKRAGGGTLLHDAYEQVDMVVTLCGLPEQVYAVAGWFPGPGDPRPYDTEDAMSVVCRYAQDRFATVASYRTAGGDDWKVTLRGTAATAEVLPQSLRVLSSEGDCVSQARVCSRNRYTAAVAAFADSLLEGTDLEPTSQDHLPTMAVIQSAYLSARTSHPESPAKFLHLAGNPQL
ncbi:MAG: Gfo/Idh/MocA family oxidoreductase [Phycisphaerae bacterium]|nr:Gfo/Idh/MocA family oxidoreductase [Phycisphaerae bacterium]